MEDKNSDIVSNLGNTVDVSSFLVVEGSADSSDQVGPDYGLFKVCFDEDDAESCCYDHDTMISDHDTFDCCDDDDDDDDGEDCCDDLTDGDDKRSIRRPEPSWGAHKIWLGSDGAALELECSSDQLLEGEGNSKVCVDTSRDVMDQMEDRLFWETCMAAGYP